MRFQYGLALALATAGFANPIALFNFDDKRSFDNFTFVPCFEGTTDPNCHLIRQPTLDIITEVVHVNGSTETKRNLYTREQLRDVRIQNNVSSIEHKQGQDSQDVEKREVPPVCWTETQKWFDQTEWGYWYNSWQQVGSCFYCDECTWAIASNFAITQTWTVGLSATFDGILQASFGFSWGQTYGLTDTRTCSWKKVESGCHSIWYQPLMSYHNGAANVQKHQHCGPYQGLPAHDAYYDHSWTWANVNQAGNNGVNQGNLGCNSGCGGNDHRQCTKGNSGGVLWPNAN